MSTPVLHLLAGPNGAGKTTFAIRLRAITHLPFVNADLIAAKRWPDAQLDHAYAAAEAAADERVRLMERGSSFITETVFSHPSKVVLVQDAAKRGYLVHLHVMLVPAGLAVARVHHRVARGGHDVPEEKIQERYARLWALVAQARTLADRATFYDNSRAKTAFHPVAEYDGGRLVGEPHWPGWTPGALIST